MNAAAVITDAAGAGVSLWRSAGRLQFRAPRGALTPALRASIAEHRAELLRVLPDEGPARPELVDAALQVFPSSALPVVGDVPALLCIADRHFGHLAPADRDAAIERGLATVIEQLEAEGERQSAARFRAVRAELRLQRGGDQS